MTNLPLTSRKPESVPAPAELYENWRRLILTDALLDLGDFRVLPLVLPGMSALHWTDDCGNDLYGFFEEDGAAVIFGFDHESPMTPYREEPQTNWPGLFDGLPERFAALLTEFPMIDSTFCLWSDGETWEKGPVAYPDEGDADGSEWILEPLAMEPASYVQRYVDLLEEEFQASEFEWVFDGAPLTQAAFEALRCEMDWEAAQQVAQGLGYPVQ